jgi:predicted RNA-binding protein Jag
MKRLKLFEDFSQETPIEHDIDDIINSYFEAALWTDEDRLAEEVGDESAKSFTIFDFSEETKIKAKEEIEQFMDKVGQYLTNITDDMIGHDFWLTRNHHGAGFWDRKEIEYEIGDKISEICNEFRELMVVVGDDGKLYLE